MASKQDGVGAITQADSATEQVATPQLYLKADDIQIEGDGQTISEKSGISPDRTGVLPVGFNYNFSISGLEPHAYAAGYLWYLALGGCSGASTTHTITPAADAQYVNVYKDYKEDISSAGTGETVEVLLGGRITSIEMEVNAKQFCSMNVNGIGCNLGTPAASLTASHPTGANNRALSWNTLRAGQFTIGYNGGAQSLDTSIVGLKVMYNRTMKPEETTLADDISDSIVQGPRTLDFEVSRVFKGSAARSEYNAWKSQWTVGISFKFVVGTYEFEMEIDDAQITGPNADPVGIGEDTIMGKLRAEAYLDSTYLTTITVIDGVTGIYP